MKRLSDIPEPEFSQHDKTGTLGDSEEITEETMEIFDRQLHPHGLEIVMFDNGAALNWFIQKRPNKSP